MYNKCLGGKGIMVKTLCIDVLSDNSACGVHRIIITIIIFKLNGGGGGSGENGEDQERTLENKDSATSWRGLGSRSEK